MNIKSILRKIFFIKTEAEKLAIEHEERKAVNRKIFGSPAYPAKYDDLDIIYNHGNMVWIRGSVEDHEVIEPVSEECKRNIQFMFDMAAVDLRLTHPRI